ncbi:hypothetical protein D3C83_12140 [compost metagenome]
MLAVKGAGREVDVVPVDRLLHFVEPDAARGERLGIELDAHGVLLAAENLDLRHAVDRGDALREQRFRVFVHLR